MDRRVSLGAGLAGVAALAAFLLLLVRKGPVAAVLLLGVAVVLIAILSVASVIFRKKDGKDVQARHRDP